MKHSKKKTITIESFSPLPPLSFDEFKRLERLARQNHTTVLGAGSVENGPYVRLVIVLDGNWRLIEQEMRRMGREFNEPFPYWLGSDDAELA